MQQWMWILSCAVALAQSPGADSDLTRYVNPFIGTGEGAPDFGMGNAAGNTPPGAAFPFGMALWSPDTTRSSGGYRYHHGTVSGFSLTHFSGRGIGCWQDLPVMPVPGTVGVSPGAGREAYGSGFSHGSGAAPDAERASPGYYSVQLNNGAGVGLTVSRRGGMGRFTFSSDSGTLLVHSGGSANGNWGETWLKVGGRNEIYGAVTSGDCGGSFNYTLYFVALFDREFTASGTWRGDEVTPEGTQAEGANSGAYLTFDTKGGGAVQMKVGLSFVSYTNAYDNLTTEIPGWDFERVREQARQAWNARLQSIQVEDSAEAQKTVFYTALYHASIHPSTFSDSNGDYLGFDGKVHRTLRTQYHNIPSWDFYRSMAPLLAITAPDVASDLAQSLVNDAQQDPGGGMPRWVHAATDSCGMFGDGSTKLVAAVFAFGARDFDARGALDAMLRGASQTETSAAGCPVREGLADYLALGYVSTSLGGSVSRTLEYVASDFSIAQFAAALGDGAISRTYLQRSQNWRNLVHENYLMPRDATGNFQPGVGPDGCTSDAFIEGSEGQYEFMVRFNANGLFDAMGSRAAAVARLDRHFQLLNAGPCSEFAFMGNEVSLMTPWMYAFAGAPWKTQAVVRKVLMDLYSNTPGGLPGNDDGGVLSSWAVLAQVGLYPQIAGVGGLVVGSPIFPRVRIALANGKVLEIAAPGAAADKMYVQNLRVNGQDYGSAWIPWDTLASGGSLEFSLGAKANPSWGTQASAAPPSYEDGGER